VRSRTLVASLSLTFALAASFVASSTVAAAETEYRKGPDPTAAALQTNGTFAYASTTVADAATPGFGAATIYYPTDTSVGTFGGVAISPGYTEKQSAISWWGPRLASQGFVVITIDTNSIYDQPAARGDELLAALDYLSGSSSVKARVDGSRLAVMGHSMGGGGTLDAEKKRPSLQAGVPLAAWNTDTTWPEITTPTMLIGAQNDSVAPVKNHSIPFYNSIPATTSKAYLELAGATHNTTNSANPTASEYAVAWLKRFVDNDTRYTQFLCPAPATSATISAYLANCPYA
jgi:alpha-beta hydrolase superfamily lysophospholipase